MNKVIHIVTVLILAVMITACATSGGDVVVVKTVEDEAYSGLADEERARLEEIKRTAQNKGMDSGLSNVIQSTPAFTAAEYTQAFPEAAGNAAREYRVGGYDVLNIVVYEEEDLTRKAVRVSADGYITFPFIGQLHVEGLTPSEIGDLITRKLAEGQYLLDAHVSVLVAEYNSKRYLVLGEVEKSGSNPLRARERVLDALSKAGGIKTGEDSGAGKRGMIIRTLDPNTVIEKKIVVNLDLNGLLQGRDQISNLYLQDQDMLYIPPAEHFYIIGQVQEPGSYPMSDRDITLVEAISRAGGFTPIAARNKTRIIRVEEGVEKILEVRVDAITDAGKKSQDIIVQPNDVIVVPESFF